MYIYIPFPRTLSICIANVESSIDATKEQSVFTIIIIILLHRYYRYRLLSCLFDLYIRRQEMEEKR